MQVSHLEGCGEDVFAPAVSPNRVVCSGPMIIHNLRLSDQLLNVDELGRMRRALARMLDLVNCLRDAGLSRGDWQRISRLARDRYIPRSIAAMMRTITEVRNVMEYDEIELTASEDHAVRASWIAVQDWASSIVDASRNRVPT